MIVNTIPCLNDNYSYCLLSSNNQDACIVDPGEFEPIDLFLTKKKIKFKIYIKYPPSFRSCWWKFTIKKQI